MKVVEVIVEHAGKNLSAYVEGASVITVGNFYYYPIFHGGISMPKVTEKHSTADGIIP